MRKSCDGVRVHHEKNAITKSDGVRVYDEKERRGET